MADTVIIDTRTEKQDDYNIKKVVTSETTEIIPIDNLNIQRQYYVDARATSMAYYDGLIAGIDADLATADSLSVTSEQAAIMTRQSAQAQL